MYNNRSRKNSQRSERSCLHELEVFDFTELPDVPERYREESREVLAETPQAQPSNSLSVLKAFDNAKTFMDIVRKGFEAVQLVIFTPDRGLDRQQMMLKYDLIKFYHKHYFDANLINLQAEKQKEVQIDLAKEWARIRDANPHLYRNRDSATLQLIDEEIHSMSERAAQAVRLPQDEASSS